MSPAEGVKEGTVESWRGKESGENKRGDNQTERERSSEDKWQ